MNDRTPKSYGSSGFLIASACLLLLLSFGYRAGFGLFVRPITEANGWSREIISIALAIQNLIWGLNATAGILVGAGIAGTSFGIILPAMARAVGPQRQQWALGLGTAAGSFGQFAIVPLAQILIEAYSWVTALHILAGSALIMALLAMPLAPYSGKQSSGQMGKEQTVPEALQEAVHYRSFLLLVLGFFVCGFHVAFITAHMPAFLTDAGFDPKVGAWSISIIGLCNVFGAYLSGIVSGRLPKRSVLVFIYAARAAVITLFLLIPFSLISVMIFSAFMGFLWLATAPPTAGLVAVMFGTRYMAMLYGIVFLGHQVGSFIGVWLGGWLYERSGSYDMVWWLGAVLGVMAAFVHWLMSEKPVKRRVAENI